MEQDTRPDKALYSITRRGREVLRVWVEEVEEEPAGGSSIHLMKIFFGWAGAPEAALGQLAAYEAWLRRRAAQFEATAAGLALDFRGHGGSASASFVASLRLGGDLTAAVPYLRAHGARKVYLLGASMGGSAVVVGGANIRPRVDGVVAVSPADYLLDAPKEAGRLRVPVLYLAGSRDPGAAAQSRHLFAATPGRAKALAVYDDWRHGVDLVDGNAVARKRVERFLAR